MYILTASGSALFLGASYAMRAMRNLTDAIALIVGIVIGAGIFETPALVAANTDSNSVVLLTWLIGGVISLIGALCYAELATAYPHAGGNYIYLKHAFGQNVALGSLNASIFTGARTNYAFGQDVSLFSFLGRWRVQSVSPNTGFLVQGAIALG